MSAAWFVLWCPAASAAVGRVDGSCDKYGNCSDTLVYKVAPGERLDVRLDDTRSATRSAITIADRGTVVRAGAGCAATGPHELRSSATAGSEGDLQVVEVHGGDRGNSMNASGIANSEVQLFGGRGSDRMLGAAHATGFFPGGGVDSVDGGAGGGVVSFAGLHLKRLYVNLAEHIARGPSGLLVHLRNIENAHGGSENDTLIGDSAPNVLCGGPGPNLIEGKGGNDVIGSHGPAELIAGPGHSILGACGHVGDPMDVNVAGRVAFVCADAADECISTAKTSHPG